MVLKLSSDFVLTSSSHFVVMCFNYLTHFFQDQTHWQNADLAEESTGATGKRTTFNAWTVTFVTTFEFFT